MVQFLPFAGIRYNSQMIGDLAQVLCPPYDIISPVLQAELAAASQHNFVKIEFNPEKPGDGELENRYTRAAASIANWLKEGILVRDNPPAIYLHLHQFEYQGRSLAKTSLVGRLKLEEWETRAVRPHENIIPRAKSDRMSMLRACHADTSEVLALYEDPRKAVAPVVDKYGSLPPQVSSRDYLGHFHRLWAVSDPEDIRKIQKVLQDQPVYIADGHHRYDSALTYRREMLAKGVAEGEAGFNYVMMALTDFRDPGMLILPTHRLVKGLRPEALYLLRSKLLAYFEIQSLEMRAGDFWKKVDELLPPLEPDMKTIRLGLCGLESGKLSILTLRSPSAVERTIAGPHGQLYKKLDVSLVDHVILDSILGFIKDRDPEALIYTHDREEALRRVTSGEYQLAFILSPIGPEIIKGIADASDRMPRKSTYFFPKSPAGLVFYAW